MGLHPEDSVRSGSELTQDVERRQRVVLAAPLDPALPMSAVEALEGDARLAGGTQELREVAASGARLRRNYDEALRLHVAGLIEAD